MNQDKEQIRETYNLLESRTMQFFLSNEWSIGLLVIVFNFSFEHIMSLFSWYVYLFSELLVLGHDTDPSDGTMAQADSFPTRAWTPHPCQQAPC